MLYIECLCWSRYYIWKERADDDSGDDGGADLVFMAVCRPTHGFTILFHSLQSHREGGREGWCSGGGARVQEGRGLCEDSFAAER